MKIAMKTCFSLACACALTAIAAFPAHAAGPQTIDDCEKIDEAFAYNSCLAKFGPRAGGVRHGSGGGADVPRGPPSAADRKAARRHSGPQRLPAHGGLQLRQTKDGRVVAEFSIGGVRPQPRKKPVQ